MENIHFFIKLFLLIIDKIAPKGYNRIQRTLDKTKMEKQNICNFNFNRSSDLFCTSFVHEKNDSQRNEISASRHSLYLVIEGCGVLSVQGKEKEITKGDVFLLRRGERFFVRSSDGLEYCYIGFDGRRGDELIERFDLCGGTVLCNETDIIPFWTHCIESADKKNIDLLSEAVLLYTFARLKPTQVEQSDLLSTMVAVTNDSFSDSDFNLLSLASKIGYDDKYISSVFKKHKGITYSQYLRELRLRHAVFLIEQGLVSVKNIAILSGFGDPLYFSKVFKSAYGITPNEYIKNIQTQSKE